MPKNTVRDDRIMKPAYQRPGISTYIASTANKQQGSGPTCFMGRTLGSIHT
jgi:hypothetical protein